uniref:Uncharacterized mitochondrial protein AtMg00810-like n=1 Tax=Tanacetum cinerariifolium TaxID=118510 RepID=A0A6L2K281_TANCI|nr:uncharacterized mitochondrial protein AtMg00810-like [Tanacetum cinerariifolium]
MPPTRDLSFTGLDEFVNKPVTENCRAKSSEKEPKVVRKNNDAPIIEEWVSDNKEKDVSQPKIEKKIVRPSIVKKKFVKSKQQENTARKTVIQVEHHGKNTHSLRGNQRNWNNMMSQKLGNNFEMFNKACYVCGSFDHLQGNLQIDLQDQRVIDSGCSRLMTGNMSYHTNYEEIDGYYFAFGGNPKGEKIHEKISVMMDPNLQVMMERRLMKIQEKKINVMIRKRKIINSTNNVNTISSTVDTTGTNRVNVVGENISIKLPFDLKMPALEDVDIFDFPINDKDDDVVADMNNLDTIIQVSPTPTIRIHKDHPLDQVIEDLHSATQTRKMAKNFKEHGFVSTIQQRTNHKDLQNCLFACFLSPEEPKKDLKIQTFLIEYTRLKKHCMDYIKLPKLDDIIFGSTKKRLCIAFEKLMHEKFQMSSMRELTFFLRLQVKQKMDGTFISEDKYVAKILKKIRFTEVKTVSTPMETQMPLLKDEDGKEVDVHMYRSLIGSLMYLTSSRLDIMFAVCAYARYKVNPKVSHLYDVKRIFRLGKGFSGKVTPLFQTMVIQNQSKLGEDEAVHKELGDSLVRASTTASSLRAEQDSGNITKTQSKATPNESSSQGRNSRVGPRCRETMGDTTSQIRFESVSKHPNNLLFTRGNILRSDEDSMKLNELMALCTTLQNMVLDLEKTTTTQRNEIDSLKRRVKKIKKRNRSRTHKLKRLYKVGLSARVESSGYEESLEMFDVDDLGGDEVFVAGQNENVVEEVVNAAQVSTTTTSITITTEEITLDQALESLKTSKPKVKGIVFQDLDEEEVAIDDIPLAVKSPRIVDWKIHKEKLLTNKDLYKLIKARYGSTRPVDNMDYLLWSDMKTMFEPHVEYEIYMLVKYKYPLKPPTLSMMLEKKLQIDYESKIAYQLSGVSAAHELQENILSSYYCCSGDTDNSGILFDKGNDQCLETQSNTSRDESSISRNECNDKITFVDDTDIRPSYDTKPMAEFDSNTTLDLSYMCDNDNQVDQNAEACYDERVALANLIANLKLNIDKNKKIQNQLKKANATLTQELKEFKSTLEETNITLGESNSTRDSCLIALQSKQTELEMYKTLNGCTVDYDKLKHLHYIQSLKKEIDELESDKADFSNIYDLLLQEFISKDVMCSYLHSLSDFDAYNELKCLYLHKVKECECLAEKVSKQNENVSKEGYNELLRSFAKLEKHLISLELALQQFDVSNDLKKPVTQHSWLQVRKSSFVKPYDVNAPSLSRIRPKHVSFQSPNEFVGSNDMVHKYYLEEAKNKAQL